MGDAHEQRHHRLHCPRQRRPRSFAHPPRRRAGLGSLSPTLSSTTSPRRTTMQASRGAFSASRAPPDAQLSSHASSRSRPEPGQVSASGASAFPALEQVVVHGNRARGRICGKRLLVASRRGHVSLTLPFASDVQRVASATTQIIAVEALSAGDWNSHPRHSRNRRHVLLSRAEGQDTRQSAPSRPFEEDARNMRQWMGRDESAELAGHG